MTKRELENLVWELGLHLVNGRNKGKLEYIIRGNDKHGLIAGGPALAICKTKAELELFLHGVKLGKEME